MDLSDVKQIYLGEDEVIQITDDQGNIMWKKESPEPVTDLFYIKDESGNGCTITITGNSTVSTLSYSSDLDTWTSLDMSQISQGNLTFQIPANNKVWLKGEFVVSKSTYYTITGNANHSIGGNILSICDYSNYQSMTTIHTRALNKRFQSDTYLTDASNVNLGLATTVDDYAMQSMFEYCSSLVSAPDFSTITSVGVYGMYCMLSGCSALLSAPDLSNLTSVGDSGIGYMFQGCTSLTTAPNLSGITTIGNYGLASLYNNCSVLTTVYTPNVSTWNGTGNWLNGVAATGTLYCPSQAVASAIPDNSASGCPTGWQKALIS